jgi:hypothetical protein
LQQHYLFSIFCFFKRTDEPIQEHSHLLSVKRIELYCTIGVLNLPELLLNLPFLCVVCDAGDGVRTDQRETEKENEQIDTGGGLTRIDQSTTRGGSVPINLVKNA